MQKCNERIINQADRGKSEYVDAGVNDMICEGWSVTDTFTVAEFTQQHITVKGEEIDVKYQIQMQIKRDKEEFIDLTDDLNCGVIK